MVSLNNRAAEELFSGKVVQFELYLHISKYIESFDKVKIKVTKTQVSFASKRQFAWVWLPKEWDKRRPPNSIVLSFSMGRHVYNSQITQVVEPYPGRYMHHVIIQKKSD